jgi:hypothetical protein
LAKAPFEPGKNRESKIAVQERNNRHQCSPGSAADGDADGLKPGMKVLSQIGRLDPICNDDEVPKRCFGGEASHDGLG